MLTGKQFTLKKNVPNILESTLVVLGKGLFSDTFPTFLTQGISLQYRGKDIKKGQIHIAKT